MNKQLQNRDSIFNRVLQRQILIMLIPFWIVIYTICFLSCYGFKNKQRQISQEYVNEYASNLAAQIETMLQKSSYIVNNDELLHGFNRTYDSIYDTLSFCKSTEKFFNTITDREQNTSMLLYTDNPTLFEGKYILKDNNFPEFQNIIDSARLNQTVIWDKTIRTDHKNKPYFIFYRPFLLDYNHILVCRVYTPESLPYANNIFLMDCNQKEELSKKKYVYTTVNDMFYMVMPFETHDLYTQYVIYTLTMTVIGLFCTIGMIILCLKVTTNITADLEDFIAKVDVENLIESNIDALSAPGDPRELRILKKAVNGLIQKFNDVTETYYQTELEKRKIELNLLQSKLNPHILYNSLSAIKLNAFKHKDFYTLDIIRILTKYYQSLLNYGNEMASIREEIEMIEQYVRIFEITQDKPYLLNIDIPEYLLEKKILHLALQPFVENALIHGLSGNRENCKINIHCVHRGTQLYFTIEDNGFGIASEKVEQLNNRLMQSGYGLRNTWERIRLIYGNDCGYKFESIVNRGTTVYIQLKYLEN